MPMPTIPGVPPEVWTQLLQLLGQMGTDIQTITSQGITTFDGLKQWLTTQGYELVEISEVVGYTIAKTTAVDPANTNAVSTQVITDITTVGGAGTAVSTVASGGNRTLGLVSKVVAVGACMSLLIASIGAGLVSDEVKEDLITSADPYTIDGENIPVLIDENGKTHFPSDLIETIRSKAVELGVFAVNSEVTAFTPTDGYVLSRQGIYPYPIPLNNHTRMYTSQSLYLEITDADFTIGFRVYNQSSGVSLVGIKKGTPGHTYNSYDGRSTAFPFSKTINGQTFYYVNNSNSSGYQYNRDYAYQLGYYFNIDDLIHLIYFNTSVIEGGGVEGITPASDLLQAGVADLTKKIDEVIPALDTGKLQTANPTETNLENKLDWYPVSINSADVFESGATEDDTSTAPDGNVNPDMEPSIMTGLLNLIEDLLRDPDHPDEVVYPEIEVGDSGDTPPENPPLTPGSGSNGSNGLWSIYNPSMQNVQDFGAWLWSDTLADQFKRIFNSPIDGVIGFHMIYCTPSVGASKYIQCGFLTSPVSAPVVTNPYAEIDCGTVEIGEFYRNALDYDNTRISLYLPFIGIVPLDTNIVMGSSLNVLYRVDILTGTCIAQVRVIKENSDAVMYTFQGNCAVQVPLTATTYTGMVGALLSGISAGVSVMTGNLPQAFASGFNAIGNAIGGKAGNKQSGTMGSNAGALGIRIPYLIITHPVSYMPYEYNKLEGMPANIFARLGSLSGFTRVRAVHLENIPEATAEELAMIEEQLKEGVIL